MSIYSDYNAGALTDEEFKSLCQWENAKDRYDQEIEEIEEADDDRNNKDD